MRVTGPLVVTIYGPGQFNASHPDKMQRTWWEPMNGSESDKRRFCDWVNGELHNECCLYWGGGWLEYRGRNVFTGDTFEFVKDDGYEEPKEVTPCQFART